MNTFKRRGSLLAVAGALGSGLCLWAQPGDGVVPYPEGFREWVHVRSALVGPESKAFAEQGGLHHFYANANGVKGHRTGAFPDGCILIDDLLEAKTSAGITSAGPRRSTAVMVKDRERFRETGGWGFEVFKGEGRDGTLTTASRAACFACHTKGRDSVFAEMGK